MATPAQSLANHANAQRSTGPRSAQGKHASSANATSHGLTSRSALAFSEDPQEYALFHRAFQDRYLPQNLLEQKMVTQLADLEWRLRRVPQLEAEMLNGECLKLTTDPDLLPLIEGLDTPTQILALAFRRLADARALPNLLHHEARLARRAEKLEKYLHGPDRFFQPSVHSLGKYQQPEPQPENQKNEPNPAATQTERKPTPFVKPPQPTRNEPCPCGSGQKFKRCCLLKPQADPHSVAA